MWLQVITGTLMAGTLMAGTLMAGALMAGTDELQPGDGASSEQPGELTLTAKDAVEALLFDLGEQVWIRAYHAAAERACHIASHRPDLRWARRSSTC
jgi:hypothetical protein